jgi:hypothetical protein
VIIAHHLVIALLAKEPVRGAARHAVADFVGDGVHGVHRHLLVSKSAAKGASAGTAQRGHGSRSQAKIIS